MISISRRHGKAISLLGLLAVIALGACNDDKSIAAPRPTLKAKPERSISVSNPAIALLAVELSGGGLKQPLLYDFWMDQADSKQSLSIPAGGGYGAIVRGYDQSGQLTHEAKLEIGDVVVGPNRAIELELLPVVKAKSASVIFDLVGEKPVKDGYRIVVRADKKEVYDGESVTLRAIVYDASGAIVPVDPAEVHWAIVDPRGGRIDPFMSRDMAMAKYSARWYLEAGYADLIAEWRNFRQDILDNLVQDNFVDVSAGGEVTCGLKSRGRVYCWGVDSRHMIASTVDSACSSAWHCSSAPLLVEGGKRFSSVSVGESHICAVEQTTGVPYCWGDNLFGVSGQPTTVDSVAFPMAVSGSPPAFASISAGWMHTCGVTTAGAAMCWGYGSSGQLGSSSTQSAVPVAVSAPTSGAVTYKSVSAGFLHSCGITTTNQIFCWGSLGGKTSSIPVEVAKQNSSDWVTLSTSTTALHVCATNAANLTYCWGDDGSGQLGDNNAGYNHKSSTPVLVKDASGLVAFSPAFSNSSAGYVSTCGITGTGSVFCWGEGMNGELGNGSMVPASTPVSSGFHVFSKIAVGNAHACALDTNADIFCWGMNTWGQVGIGTRNTSLTIGTLTVNGVSTPTKVVPPIN